MCDLLDPLFLGNFACKDLNVLNRFHGFTSVEYDLKLLEVGVYGRI
jgi:hypothetical protein